jgi:hypothetical protein
VLAPVTLQGATRRALPADAGRGLRIVDADAQGACIIGGAGLNASDVDTAAAVCRRHGRASLRSMKHDGNAVITLLYSAVWDCLPGTQPLASLERRTLGQNFEELMRRAAADAAMEWSNGI